DNIILRRRIVSVQPELVRSGHEIDVAPAKDTVGAGEMEGPVKLLTNGVNKNGIARFGKLIYPFCPERHGKADEQHSLNQDDGKFQVRRDPTGHAFVIGHGMAAAMITKEDEQKKGQPSNEESGHEPVTKLQDVIDLI